MGGNSNGYTYCFICSEKIAVLSAEKLRLNAFEKKQNDVIGTLCQLLSLPLRDNTLNYGLRFRDTRFCSICTSNMKGFNKILTDLKILENKVLEARKVIEDQLKETCRIMSKMDLKGSLNGLKDIDAFRKEILTELNKTHPWSMLGSKSARSNSGDSSQYARQTFQGSEGPNGNAWSQVVPKLETMSPLHEIKTEPSEWVAPAAGLAQSQPTGTGASILSPSFSDENLEFPIGSDSGDEDEPDEFEDEEDGPPSDAKFVTDIIPPDQNLTKKKIVVPTRGKFPCPFAPLCKFTFSKKERIKFLAHNHQYHKTKVEKVIDPRVVVKLEIKTEEPETNGNDIEPKIVVRSELPKLTKPIRPQVDNRDKCETCRIVFNSRNSYLRHLTKVHSNNSNLITPQSSQMGNSISISNPNGNINMTQNVSSKRQTPKSSPSPTRNQKKRKSRGHGWGKKSSSSSTPRSKPKLTYEHTNGICSKIGNGIGTPTGITGVDGYWKRPRLEIYSPASSICMHPFKCDKCGLKYLFKADLTRHMIMTHDG